MITKEPRSEDIQTDSTTERFTPTTGLPREQTTFEATTMPGMTTFRTSATDRTTTFSEGTTIMPGRTTESVFDTTIGAEYTTLSPRDMITKEPRSEDIQTDSTTEQFLPTVRNPSTETPEITTLKSFGNESFSTENATVIYETTTVTYLHNLTTTPRVEDILFDSTTVSSDIDDSDLGNFTFPMTTFPPTATDKRERTSKQGPFFGYNESSLESTTPIVFDGMTEVTDIIPSGVMSNLSATTPSPFSPNDTFIPRSRILSRYNDVCDTDDDCSSYEGCFEQFCVDVCSLFQPCSKCYGKNHKAWCSCPHEVSGPYVLCSGQVAEGKNSYP